MKNVLRSALALGAVGLAACEEPDTYAALSLFEDAALGGDDVPDGVPSDGSEVDCPRPTPAGTYLCALSANLAREKPLYLSVDFSLSGDTLTAAAQPVEIDVLESGDPNPNKRLPTGGPLPTLTVDYGVDGEFVLDWTDVTIVGAANPLTFRDIGGSFILEGRFYSDGVAYGDMSGEVTSPTTVPLNGSDFACQRADDLVAIDPVYYNADAAALVTGCE